MSGLVCIVAHDRSVPVDVDEVELLAVAYESLRGATGRHHRSAGGYARAIGLGSEAERHAMTYGDSWTVTVGAVHSTSDEYAPRLEEAEGQFAWISYDADNDELKLASDPFGMLAVYVAHRDHKTYMATSALALAKHLRSKPSRLGLEIFLRAGYHFGKSTNWEGIHRLEPGSCIVFGEDGPRFETYWRPEIDVAVGRMKLKEVVHHCTEVATGTYARLFARDPGPWVDLSGGFDTRLVTLLLRAAGVDFRANTNGDETSPDVRIARRIAELGHWKWVHLKLPNNWDQLILELLPTSVTWSDGHLDALQLATVLWGHRERSRVDKSLLTGGGGEHFRNFAWQQEFLNAGRSTQVNMSNWIDMRLLHPIPTEIFAYDPTENVRADLSKRMLDWASPYSGELNTTQLDIMYAYKMTGHFGAYLSAAGAFLEQQHPFYFRPIFEAAFSTNHRYRANHRLMRHMMAGLDPRIAAEQTTSGGPAEPWRISNFHRFMPYYSDTARRGATKLSRKVIGRSMFAERGIVSDSIVAARRTVLDRLIRDNVLVPSRMRAGQLFNPAALVSLNEQARRADFPHDRLLGRIVTIELALQAVDASLDT